MRSLLISFFACILLAGCASLANVYTDYTVAYDIELESVERPTDAAMRYGDYTIAKLEEDAITKYSYVDSLISIVLVADGGPNVTFKLENQSPHSLRLVWDDAAFIHTDGSSSKVMHTGVRYLTRNEPQSSSVIPRGASVTDVIMPNDRVLNYGRGWTELPILHPYNQVGGTSSLSGAAENVGKRFSALLPIQVEGVTNDYLFTFLVTGATVPTPATG
jgi:hypothetical protein